MSAPRAAVSGSNCMALKTSFHSDKPRQPSVESCDHNWRQGCYGRGDVAPGGLKHQNTQALLDNNNSWPYVKKAPLGAREHAEDAEPARVNLRQHERMIHASHNHSK